jgi:ABC-type sugar transport system ATPase subunit
MNAAISPGAAGSDATFGVARQGEVVLECRGISKHFGATPAVVDIALSLRSGEAHAILGENGAGKSTLIKILAGVHKPDSGALIYRGAEVAWRTPLEARSAGVAVVHQELSLVSQLTVAENIFLRREPRSRLGFVSLPKMNRRTEALLEELGISGIRPYVEIRQLSPSERQLVEIAKAVKDAPLVLILDEPTSALGEQRVAWLSQQISNWRERGVAIAFISHRMSEIGTVSDTITVLRNGRTVLQARRGAVGDHELIAAMSGRRIEVAFPRLAAQQQRQVLRVEHLSGHVWPRGVTMTVAAGEIVGIGGLEGQGQEQLLHCIYGLAPARGTVTIGERGPFRRWTPRTMRELGVGFVPADRTREGLLQRNSIEFNIALPWLSSFSRWSFLNRPVLRAAIDARARQLALSTNDYSQPVSALSGGNQQKVVIAKWLLEPPKLLILYDITRGVDVGTKVQLYELLAALAAGGVGILFYTTDITELVNLSHRVYVMSEGEVRAELRPPHINERNVLSAAFRLTPAPGVIPSAREAGQLQEG